MLFDDLCLLVFLEGAKVFFLGKKLINDERDEMESD